MTRVADDRNSSVISPPHCEIDKALSGEEVECQRKGEVRYRGALLCEAHATLLKLQDRARTVLGSVFRMDEWLETNASRNGSVSADEEFVGRIRYERDEAVGALRPMRGQIQSARKALSGKALSGKALSGKARSVGR
jgi:hypothetical protein